MLIINSFIFCGLICMIGQIILDNTTLTPGHVTTIFVVLGTFLDIFNFYDKIVLIVGGGALVPITSFGHLLIHGALKEASNVGVMGLSIGMLDLVSSGVIAAIVLSFVLSLIFKPKN